MDLLRQAKFEGIIESTLPSCDGQTMCLDEIDMDGEKYLGMSTRCETRFYWASAKYLTITEDMYAQAANGTVPQETQKWVILTKSGCLKMLREEFPLAGDRVLIDSGCSEADAYHDTEFWALTDPKYLEHSLNEADDVFSIVDAHLNNSRRYAYFVNRTKSYVDPATGDGNCTCVSSTEEDKLGTLMTSRRHMHLVHETYEHSLWNQFGHCDGHVLRLRIFPPSPPPPEGTAAPPAPPLLLWETPVAFGSFAVSGLWLCFCFICCGACVGGRIRGKGRNKWWGVREMRIDRPPIANGDASDNRIFSVGGSFLESLPPASRPLLSGP